MSDGGGIALHDFFLSDLGLGESIGFGAQGQVRKVRRAKGFGTVAAKLFNTPHTNTEAELLRIRRELIAALKLSHHPNILAFHGFLYDEPGPQQNVHGFVMEYMNNGSVFDVTRSSKQYGAEYVLNWSVQAARGLAFCHEHNVLHRDVKPQNLLLSQNCTVLKVCDFGHSREVDPNTTHSLNVGTLYYMAPEVMHDETYNEKCDVYSLAITIWEMFHRRFPFEERNPLGLRVNVLSGVRPKCDLSLVSQDMRVFLERGWHHNKEERSTMQQMLAKLEADTANIEPENLHI